MKDNSERAQSSASFDSSATQGRERVLVIVPAFNEAASLPELLSDLRRDCPDFDVVVIDDGSTDDTAEAASTARVISLPCNLGIGGAVQTGLHIAYRENYDIAVQVDGDGQHPPREAYRLAEYLRMSGCDIVVGSRFREEGGFKSSASRRVGIRFFSFLLKTICKVKVSDPTSGCRAMNRRAITLLARRYPEDFPEVEALVIAHCAGLQIGEIAVQLAERHAGRSSIGVFKSFIYMVKVPLAILMTLIRNT